jgi:hypothetical protein
MTTIRQLFDTLNERKRPEDVAEMVMELTKDNLTTKELVILEKATKGSLSKSWNGYTSMLQTFAKAKGAEKQVNKAFEIFGLQNIEKLDYNVYENIEKCLNCRY